MIGVGLCCLSMVFLGAIFFVHTISVEQKNQVFKEKAIGFLIVFAVILVVIGFAITMTNLPNWIAPTKQVVLQVMRTIN